MSLSSVMKLSPTTGRSVWTRRLDRGAPVRPGAETKQIQTPSDRCPTLSPREGLLAWMETVRGHSSPEVSGPSQVPPLLHDPAGGPLWGWCGQACLTDEKLLSRFADG